MAENETVPSDPATKIGAVSGRTTVELPPPLRLPNVGMGAFGFDQSGNAETASCISYDEEESIFPFKATWNPLTNNVKVAGGSYHYLNTNTDVPKTSGTGTYVYAVIKRLSGWDVNIEFSIEVTSTTKDPTNLDSEGAFVEFSNVLLAEVITVGDRQKMVQRRAGNFTMINQIVNGLLAVWPLSSGGTI